VNFIGFEIDSQYIEIANEKLGCEIEKLPQQEVQYLSHFYRDSVTN
jgi:DNA modification methylase